jgi:hypothetical protein
MLGLVESFNARVGHLKDEIGPEEYDRRWQLRRAGLESSYTSIRFDDARAQIDSILSEIHVLPSARERVSGYDDSAATLGLLQFGKLFKVNTLTVADMIRFQLGAGNNGGQSIPPNPSSKRHCHSKHWKQASGCMELMMFLVTSEDVIQRERRCARTQGFTNVHVQIILFLVIEAAIETIATFA